MLRPLAIAVASLLLALALLPVGGAEQPLPPDAPPIPAGAADRSAGAAADSHYLQALDGPVHPDVVRRTLIKEAARISDIGQDTARLWLERAFFENITEQQVIDAINSAMTDNGSNPYVDAFDTIVASGADSSIPHGDPGNDAENQVEPGEVVVVDLGARFKGWVSDNTKTYYLGTEPPENFTIAYNLVHEAQRLAYSTIHHGVLAGTVDGAARHYLEDAGYGEYFIHCTGHGLGLYVHTPPLICSPDDKVYLSAARNDVVAIEPGLYFDGDFGVRIEDDFAVMWTTYDQYTHARSAYEDILIAPANWTENSTALVTAGPKVQLQGNRELINALLMVTAAVIVAAIAYKVVRGGHLRQMRIARRSRTGDGSSSVSKALRLRGWLGKVPR